MSRKHFPLRIDPHLWAEIERLAAAELRSLNAEVEVLLREAVRRRADGGTRILRAAEHPRTNPED